MNHTCPVCHTDNAITTKVYGEWQGDRPMIGWVEWAEITKQSCPCDLTDDQQDTICEADDGRGED